ncbi:thiol-disulfide oxidoreductase DCC family protein [Luteibacter yeojuensis]|uniref:Membrane protein n=1 Tax=Luteibacter yeojuensis TaxID=345309 RepID=A0A0F3KA15_9GAMM|nr:DCC1-like thiol-disulfide oxidoreductase family protein [Luteibacter yeojuensis]KJV28090.1 membrane protein [Luteibacter yeojuensis]
MAGGPVILFDAECVLCSANAQFVLNHDKAGRFRLAAMQGPVGTELCLANGLDPANPTTILVVDGSRVWRDSDAVCEIYSRLAFPWRALSVARYVPRFLRDPVYRWVARHRYRLFGKRDTCWLPADEFRDRLL